MEIRDQYHDPSFTFLYHILNENPDARDFVKSASIRVEDETDLPDTAFAWPSRRLFPIDTPENTVLSSLYRDKCAAVPAEVDDALTKAQGIYGVKDLIGQCKTAAAAANAAAAALPTDTDEDYLLPEHHRLRVKTAEHVTAAEDLLHRDYSKLSIGDRATAFTNLVKKAQDLGVTLKPATMRMAGMTVCTTKTAQDWIEARVAATKDPLFQSAYEKLASAFEGRGEFIQDRDELVAVADALARLDKQAGIDTHYDKRLPDPIRTVFNTDKVAEEMVDMAGQQVPLSQLAEMPEEWWADVVGDDIASEFAGKTGEELKQVLDTLPLDLKLIIKNQVQ
jgi:hypothetical protein